jgi:hypothetical protein
LPEAQATAAIKNQLAEINPGITVSFQNFASLISDGLLRDRLMATLSGFFGLLALSLASVGLYGILPTASPAGETRLEFGWPSARRRETCCQ